MVLALSLTTIFLMLKCSTYHSKTSLTSTTVFWFRYRYILLSLYWQEHAYKLFNSVL